MTKDHREAARWFRLAAAQQSEDAQIYLGVMYLRGAGVKKDRELASAWFRKAAAQGSIRAGQYLAQIGESSAGKAVTPKMTKKSK